MSNISTWWMSSEFFETSCNFAGITRCRHPLTATESQIWRNPGICIAAKHLHDLNRETCTGHISLQDPGTSHGSSRSPGSASTSEAQACHNPTQYCNSCLARVNKMVSLLQERFSCPIEQCHVENPIPPALIAIEQRPLSRGSQGNLDPMRYKSETHMKNIIHLFMTKSILVFVVFIAFPAILIVIVIILIVVVVVVVVVVKIPIGHHDTIQKVYLTNTLALNRRKKTLPEYTHKSHHRLKHPREPFLTPLPQQNIIINLLAHREILQLQQLQVTVLQVEPLRFRLQCALLIFLCKGLQRRFLRIRAALDLGAS